MLQPVVELFALLLVMESFASRTCGVFAESRLSTACIELPYVDRVLVRAARAAAGSSRRLFRSS